MIGFAKKIGMTRLFIDGASVPVTALLYDTQTVVQRKTQDKDGYTAVQIAADPRKKGSKARLGHAKKHSGKEQDYRLYGEFKKVEVADDKSEFTIQDFAEGDSIDISGTTIGRGFAGAVKRYGFKGQPASHGHDHERAVGSIGQRYPQRTIKGKKMAGRMGGISSTLHGVPVVAIDAEENLIFVKGSLPGANSSFLKIQKVNA